MTVNLTAGEILTVALAGSLGSLVKDIFTDGCIQLPELKGKNLYLGFLGGALVGGFAGIMIDGSFITALMAGYTGTSIITKLVGPIKKDE